MFAEKKFVTLLVLTLLTPAVWAEMVAKVYPVKDFTEFVTGGDTHVEITQDGTEYLRVEGDAEVMQRLKVDQSGQRVSVWVKDGGNFFNWFGHGKGRIRIVLRVKNLEYLELSGGAHAEVGDLKSAGLVVKHSGAANSDFAKLEVGDLRMDLSGAANARVNTLVSREQDFDLSGASQMEIKNASTTESIKADVSGASNLKAKMINAKTARLMASGASHIELSVSDALEADASGASSINYYGNPKAKTNSSGASHVNAR